MQFQDCQINGPEARVTRLGCTNEKHLTPAEVFCEADSVEFKGDSDTICPPMTRRVFPVPVRQKIFTIHKKDHDLVLRDKEGMEKHLLRKHCNRIWEQLSSLEREAVRSQVVTMGQLDSTAPEVIIDLYCIEELMQLLEKVYASKSML